jgi:hypothetical protein
MVCFLKRPPEERKMVLFAVACCRRLREWLVDPRSIETLDVLEQFADSSVTKRQMASASRLASKATSDVDKPRSEMDQLASAKDPEAQTVEFREEYRRASRRHHAVFAVEAAAGFRFP